jgi:hypothetical protein
VLGREAGSAGMDEERRPPGGTDDRVQIAVGESRDPVDAGDRPRPRGGPIGARKFLRPRTEQPQRSPQRMRRIPRDAYDRERLVADSVRLAVRCRPAAR